MSSRQEALTANHVCPWWLAYTFDNPVRKLFHQPSKIFGSYIEKGMKVVDECMFPQKLFKKHWK